MSGNLHQFLNATDDQLKELLTEIEYVYVPDGFEEKCYTESPLAGFHPMAMRMVIIDDWVYLGNVRADHFVLIYGYSEALDNENGWDSCVVQIANHKGGLTISVYAFKDDVKKAPHFTVDEYAKLHDFEWALGKRIDIGKRMSKFCRENNLEILKADDAQFGEVNSYPTAAWRSFLRGQVK